MPSCSMPTNKVSRESMDLSQATNFFEDDLLLIAQRIETDQEEFADIEKRWLAARGRDGITLLMFAVLNKKFRSIRGLLKAGADVRLEVDRLGSPIRLAALSNDPRILQAMFQGGASPDETISDGTPVFFSAVCEGHDEVIDLFLVEGVDLSRQDIVGNTVVHEALFYQKFARSLKLVKMLKDVDVLNKQGLSIAALTRRFIEKRKNDPENLAILNEMLRVVQQKSRVGLK
jgi:hypothetical protein